MHLSIVSDAFGVAYREPEASLKTGAGTHLDGLLRGLAAIGVAAALFGLTFLSSAAETRRSNVSRAVPCCGGDGHPLPMVEGRCDY